MYNSNLNLNLYKIFYDQLNDKHRDRRSRRHRQKSALEKGEKNGNEGSDYRGIHRARGIEYRGERHNRKNGRLYQIHHR